MLTPVEIQSKVFKSGGLGYDKKDVDSYMKEILKSYEDAYRENMELKDKVAVLNDGIQHYKTIEKTLQKALVLAEKTAEDTKAAALKEAKHIEKEASLKAGIMLADARNELAAIHKRTVEIVQQYERYKAQFRNLANAQKELLESEAFDIHIESLEAFSEQQSSASAFTEDVSATAVSQNRGETAKASEKASGKASGNASGKASEVISEETSEKVIISSEHLSDYGEQSAEYDFSDFNVDGQEEFDFVDISDTDN